MGCDITRQQFPAESVPHPVDEELVHAQVAGDLRVERRGYDRALCHGHDPPVGTPIGSRPLGHARQHRHLGTHLFDPRRADEHTAQRCRLGKVGDTGEFEVSLEGVGLASERVAAHGDVERIEVTGVGAGVEGEFEKALIAGDEAAIENLKVQLSYYTLTAPVSGKVGTFSLRSGTAACSVGTVGVSVEASAGACVAAETSAGAAATASSSAQLAQGSSRLRQQRESVEVSVRDIRAVQAGDCCLSLIAGP